MAVVWIGGHPPLENSAMVESYSSSDLRVKTKIGNAFPCSMGAQRLVLGSLLGWVESFDTPQGGLRDTYCF
jgi:hypothetical protein